MGVVILLWAILLLWARQGVLASVYPTPESFQTYLVLFPEGANSVPIPLRIVNWHWQGVLTFNYPSAHTLSNTAAPYATPAPGTAWNPTIGYPTWSNLVTAATMNNILVY
jgi:hypothetical protein